MEFALQIVPHLETFCTNNCPCFVIYGFSENTHVHVFQADFRSITDLGTDPKGLPPPETTGRVKRRSGPLVKIGVVARPSSAARWHPGLKLKRKKKSREFTLCLCLSGADLLALFFECLIRKQFDRKGRGRSIVRRLSAASACFPIGITS